MNILTKLVDIIRVYREEKIQSILILCLVLLGVLFIFQGFIIEKVVNFLYVISNEVNRLALLIISGVLLLWSLVRFGLKIKDNFVPSLKSLLILSVSSFIYMYFFRFNNEVSFIYHYGVCLSDVLFGALLVFYVDYIYIDKLILNNGSFKFIEDNNEVDNEDFLSRKNYANKIVDGILNTDNIKSMSISIVAEWGYGKTTFLKYIEDALEKNQPNNNIIINFNPWKFNKQDLLSYLYELLEDEFNKIDSNISSKVKEYFSKINEVEDGDFTKYPQRILKLLGDEETGIDQKFEEINKAILRTGKRIIIFIDDLDRLLPDEIVGVIRLMRNTADFSRTFFIAAFDQQYVLESIRDKQANPNKTYLHKIFQLEIILPPIDNQIIREKLKHYLVLHNKNLSLQNNFNSLFTVSTNDNFSRFLRGNKDTYNGELDLTPFLSSVRDVKRFVNQFVLSYSFVEEEVELYDFFVIELIRYRYPDVYKSFSKGLFTQLLNAYSMQSSSSSVYIRDPFENSDDNKRKELKLLFEEYGLVDELVFDTLMIILNELFSENRKKGTRSITETSNLKLYFEYDAINLISIKDFNEVLLKADDDVIKFIKQSQDNEIKFFNLISYLNYIPIYGDFDRFERVFFILVQNSLKEYTITKSGIYYEWDIIFSKYNALSKVLELISKSNDIIKILYNNETNKYKEFIVRLIEDSNVFPIVKILILNEFIVYLKSDNNPNIFIDVFKGNEINDYSNKVFLQTLKEYYENENLVWEIYAMYYARRDQKIDINREDSVNELYKSYINKKSNYFLSKVVIPVTYPNNNLYGLNFSVRHMVSTIEDFINLVKKFEDSERKKYILNFLDKLNSLGDSITINTIPEDIIANQIF